MICTDTRNRHCQYLEEELYDILTYCIQNPNGSDFEMKKKRAEEIGSELYAVGELDAMENMFYSIEFRIKDEIGKDAKPYRAWWNNISGEWRY
jgi:thermostable 8-oxoguanine DNA glycosylase